MDKEVKNSFATVLDLGLFCELPRVLSPYFKKMGYWSNWIDPFPSKRRTRVGDFPGVIRINDYNAVMPDVDTWIVIDTLMGGIQVDLESRGKYVWGARYAEDLENHRIAFRELCDELKIPRPQYEAVKGITNLKKYLEAHEDRWIKIDTYRGDMESWHHENYKLSKPMLEKLAHDLIPFEEEQIFLCDEPFPDSAEAAYDGFVIDDKFPSKSVFGVEVKGASYFCSVMDYKDFPKQILELNNKLAPVWKDYHCRSNIPIETRILKNGNYIASDPCQREGFPCFGAKLRIIKNWPEIYHYGARGELVEPEFAAKCAMELVLSSQFADQNAQPVHFPSKIRDNVLTRYSCEKDGVIYILPQSPPNTTVGSLTVIGDNYEDCKNQIEELKDEIKGMGIEYDYASIAKLAEEWEKLKSYGIELPKIN